MSVPGGGEAEGPIFLVEDDPDVAALFRRGLEDAGFKVVVCSSVAAFAAASAEARPALAVIDLGLPDGDGLALIGGALAALGAPAIVVTGRGALDDRLAGLDQGADDYLVKPVDPRELAARVRTVLRRAGAGALPAAAAGQAGAGAAEIAVFAGWRADFARMVLTAPDGVEEPLGQSDAVLLRAFLAAPGRVLSRAQLLDACAGGGDEVFDRAIDVRVSRLRKKLRDDPRGPTHIRTVYGAGYVFASAVAWRPA